MITKIDVSKFSVPYGPLHDQTLSAVKYVDGKLTFSFDIKLYEQNYTGDVYEKYKNFNHCDLSFDILEIDDCEFSLVTSISKNNKFSGLCVSLDEFISLTEKAANILFDSCTMDGNQIRLDFNSWSNISRKYNKYDSIEVFLYVDGMTVDWH